MCRIPKSSTKMFIDQKKQMKKVLVLCTGNSCRSQMAEAYLRHFAKGEVEIFSAGTNPKGIHPFTVDVLAEDGIDISEQTSDQVSRFEDLEFDFVLTVCDRAQESCPVFPGDGLRFHYSFTDPAAVRGTDEEVKKAFISVRDEIRNYCRGFAKLYLNKDFIWEDKAVDFG